METAILSTNIAPFTPASTIDEVIEQLESIINQCVMENNRAGYFAALYQCVTIRIKEDIGKKQFEDCARMERLDVLFANRYLEAWHQYCNKQVCTTSWRIAFEALSNAHSIIMQHLLLGINAHINLDLGIATALTMKAGKLDDIQKDFNSINTVLGSLVDQTEDRVSKAAPFLFLLNLHKINLDEMLVQFSMDTARQGAWEFAVELSNKTGKEFDDCITVRDEAIGKLASSIAHPFRLLRWTVSFIHWLEKKDVATVIRILKGAD